MPSLTKNPDGTPHIHTYVRIREPKAEGKPVRYRCAHPMCTHYLDKSLVLGKRTICGKCKQKETLMDYENSRRAIPVCSNCSNSVKAQKLRGIRGGLSILDELFGEGAAS